MKSRISSLAEFAAQNFRVWSLSLIAFTAAMIHSSALAESSDQKPARLGFFPNITHAQALYAKHNGAYEQALGTPIAWTAFNAGPSAVEALFADELDGTYIGPNPTINGYIKSRGEKFVVVAGSALGGAGLVVRSDSKILSDKDFNGKTIATPQLGNTQDIAARLWFKEKGYTLSEKGGTLSLIPIANSDQINLFKKGELDGSWTVEPWISRLEQEAGGKLYLNEASLWPEGKYITTLLVLSKRFIAEHPAQAAKLVRAHVEITEKINADKTAAAKVINDQLKTELGSPLSESVLLSAAERVTFTWDPVPSALYSAADSAYSIGFTKEKPNLSGLNQLDILNEVLRSKGLQEIDAAKH